MERFSNINMLLAFVTVVREGSVSRAAEQLNLSQPAVSHQIKRLSQDCGVVLFTRTSTGLAITKEGATLVPKAEQVIHAMTEFQRSARQTTGRISGKLKIGTVVDPEFIRLGQLLHILCNQYPDIETELVHGVSGDILARLKRNQIDAGFYLSGPDDLAQLGLATDDPVHAVKLADFTYSVIAPVGWQHRIENASWAELARLPWIGTPENSVHSRLLKRIFKYHDCEQNVVALVDQEASMLEMVRSGVGLSLSRDSVALHQKHTFGIAVSQSVSVPACLSLVTMKRAKETPTIAALLDLLLGIW